MTLLVHFWLFMCVIVVENIVSSWVILGFRWNFACPCTECPRVWTSLLWSSDTVFKLCTSAVSVYRWDCLWPSGWQQCFGSSSRCMCPWLVGGASRFSFPWQILSPVPFSCHTASGDYMAEMECVGVTMFLLMCILFLFVPGKMIFIAVWMTMAAVMSH